MSEVKEMTLEEFAEQLEGNYASFLTIEERLARAERDLDGQARLHAALKIIVKKYREEKEK